MKNKDINFDYIEDFVDYLVAQLDDDDDMIIEVISKFHRMRDILKGLISYDDVDFGVINISNPNEDIYEDEFLLSVWNEDGIIHIDCEPFRDKDSYLPLCGDKVYLSDECSSKIIPHCYDSELYFVGIDNDEEVYWDSDKAISSLYDDGLVLNHSDCDNIHGFTASKQDADSCHTLTYYSSNTIDDTKVKSILRDFGF